MLLALATNKPASQMLLVLATNKPASQMFLVLARNRNPSAQIPLMLFGLSGNRKKEKQPGIRYGYA